MTEMHDQFLCTCAACEVLDIQSGPQPDELLSQLLDPALDTIACSWHAVYRSMEHAVTEAPRTEHVSHWKRHLLQRDQVHGRCRVSAVYCSTRGKYRLSAIYCSTRKGSSSCECTQCTECIQCASHYERHALQHAQVHGLCRLILCRSRVT